MLDKTTIQMNYKRHHIIITQSPGGDAKYVIFKGERLTIVGKTDDIISVGKINNVSKEILGENDLRQLVDHVLSKQTKEVKE